MICYKYSILLILLIIILFNFSCCNIENNPNIVSAGDVEFIFLPIDAVNTASIAGSFNSWVANDTNYIMNKNGISNTLTVPLEPGRYLWKLILDSNWVMSMRYYQGQFQPDQGTYIDDGFGGEISVLIVE